MERAVEQQRVDERERSVGRLVADEQPLRPDKPEAIIERQSDGPLPTTCKEDYRRTQRNGENVYVLISDPGQIITGDEFRRLKSRKEQETSSKSASSDSKNSKARIDLGFLTGKGVLTKKEADELYEPLVAVIQDDGTYLDEAIKLKNPNSDVIWGDITDQEAQILAELLLKAGQKSPIVATTIRISIEIKSYAAAIAILAPRIQMTALALKTVPKREKRPIRLFRPVEEASV